MLKACFPLSGCRKPLGVATSPRKSDRLPNIEKGKLFLDTRKDRQKFILKLCLCILLRILLDSQALDTFSRLVWVFKEFRAPNI